MTALDKIVAALEADCGQSDTYESRDAARLLLDQAFNTWARKGQEAWARKGQEA